MKEMYNSLKEAFIEDPKEFLLSLGMLSFIILFLYFTKHQKVSVINNWLNPYCRI